MNTYSRNSAIPPIPANAASVTLTGPFSTDIMLTFSAGSGGRNGDGNNGGAGGNGGTDAGSGGTGGTNAGGGGGGATGTSFSNGVTGSAPSVQKVRGNHGKSAFVTVSYCS